jgi:phosphoglycerate dehydrogenase-like enzyme
MPRKGAAVDEPLILVDPHPRTLDLICDEETRRRLEGLGRLVVHEAGPMPDGMVEASLPETALIIGQTAMPAERLARAPKLRAIINVETNFLPNVDYEACFARGVHVLAPGSAFALPVAESALAMAIDLARGITAADRAFRAGREAYGLEGNAGCFLFSGSTVGLVGFGDLGRALWRLIQPFRCEIRVFDPWVPEYVVRAHGCLPASLEEVLSASRTIFVFAGVTAENEGFLGRRQLELIRPGSSFLLMSRAAVVDFPALADLVGEGRFRAAVDVFPTEPVAAGDPVRGIEGMLLSAHRTGGMPEAFLDIGRQTVADAALILRGLPPQVCRRAQRETVGRSRSRPVEMS